MKAWIYYDRGELQLSRRHFKDFFDLAIENYPEYTPLITAAHKFRSGLVDLKEGHIDSAKTKLEKMKSLLPNANPGEKDGIRFRYDIFLAETLVAENSFDQAIAVCEKVSPLEMSSMYTWPMLRYNEPYQKDVLARAYLQKGEIDKAIVEYERLITFDPDSKDRRLVHPKYHYRLARLYEEKGWEGKAIEQYEKFLDLWKDADPGIVEVEDARKRLAGLKR
jgi:tetratricopeptide (TPR) repeat protein